LFIGISTLFDRVTRGREDSGKCNACVPRENLFRVVTRRARLGKAALVEQQYGADGFRRTVIVAALPDHAW